MVNPLSNAAICWPLLTTSGLTAVSVTFLGSGGVCNLDVNEYLMETDQTSKLQTPPLPKNVTETAVSPEVVNSGQQMAALDLSLIHI